MRLVTPLRTLTSLRSRDLLWVASLVGVGFAIEILGHGSRSEWWDALGVGIGVVFGAVTALWHENAPLAAGTCVERGARRFGRSLLAAISSFGVDLRAAPPLPHRLPPGKLAVLVSGAALAVVLLRVGTLVDLRQFLADRFYLGYVVTVGCVWAVLALGIAVILSFVIAVIHDEWVIRLGRGNRLFRKRVLFGVGVAAVLLGAAVPVELSALILLGLAAMSGAWLGIAPRMTFLWRSRSGARPVYAMSLGAVSVLLWAIFAVVAANLALLTSSSPQSVGDVLPFTSILGGIFGGCAVLGLLAAQVQSAVSCRRESRVDPARPSSPTLRLDGELSPEVRTYIADGLARFGWRVRGLTDLGEESDVPVRLVPDDAPLRTAAGPIPLTVNQLDDAAVVRWLGRQDVLRQRAILKRELQLLLDHAFGRHYRSGTGFWVNPHLWFAGGVSRDTDEDDIVSQDGLVLVDTIGPHYRTVLPRSARHHLATVFHAAEIDLVYIQDGVKFEGYWDVIERLFAIYDDEPRRVEDHDFSGVGGVRALFHDFVIEEPLIKAEGYPEPEYEEIGRARILQLFKELGEGEEQGEFDTPQQRIPRPRSLLPI